MTDLVAELRDWLDDNWDPDLTVGRVVGAPRARPAGPRRCCRPTATAAASTAATRCASRRRSRDFGALGAPVGLGLGLAAPTIATHGTHEQIDRYIPDIVTGQKGWCQLFSEPGAGSDLAGLATRAVRDGDVWIVNGQKVWTSGGQVADLGMLIARTDPTCPSTRASPGSRSTCTSPASRSARCGR